MYFKEDHSRRVKGKDFGLAFHCEKDSKYRKVTGPKMNIEPPRFDPYIDRRDKMKPSPASYVPKDVLTHH